MGLGCKEQQPLLPGEPGGKRSSDLVSNYAGRGRCRREPSRTLNEPTAKRKKSVFPSALPDTYNKVTFSSIGFSRSLALSVMTPGLAK